MPHPVTATEGDPQTCQGGIELRVWPASSRLWSQIPDSWGHPRLVLLDYSTEGLHSGG